MFDAPNIQSDLYDILVQTSSSSASDQQQSTDQQRNERQKRNERERFRNERLNNAFKLLEEKIPVNISSKITKRTNTGHLSKLMILRCAIEYIKDLSDK